jgi:general secretion pathway protein D
MIKIMKIKKMPIAFLILLLGLLINFGCATKELAYKPLTLDKSVQKPPATVEESQALGVKEKAPSHEILRPPTFERPIVEKKLPLKEPIDPKRIALSKDSVMINVEKMPLSDFIIHALGETLKVSFIMDQKVMDNKEPITLSMTQPMPPDKALEIVLGLFERYNLYVEEKAGALYILPKAPEPKQPFDIRMGREIPESPAQIFQFLPLKHIRPLEIEPLVRDIYKTNVQIRSYPKENIILLYGQASQVKQLAEFIETFDVPYFQGKKIAVFKLTYWHIEEFIKQISQILEGIGLPIAKTPKDPGILLIPIKPLGSILAVAMDDTSLNYVLHWKERLDTPEAAGAEERPFVYSPRYSKASDLVKSIRNLYGVMPTPAAPTAPTPPTAPTTPTAPPRSLTPQPTPPPITGLKISADDHKNIIMVVSSPAEYKNILSLLRELDVPPRQVLIEATVVEFTLTDELKYGIEWYLKDSILKGTWKGMFTLQSAFGLSQGPGLIYQFATDTGKFNTLINIFASKDKVNILSTPRLMVLDNEEASIQVGTDVPIVTGEVTAADVTQAQPSILRNIQYRSTGVMLRVKPTINTEGLLTLNIAQEVSEMGTNPPGMGSPTILTRRINTTVVAAHGETIALGGLMSENISHTESKIPLLGDIPILGELFKTTSKEKRKTELLVLLTPTILTSVSETSKITEELKKELKWLK